jgi:hypothetical protein
LIGRVIISFETDLRRRRRASEQQPIGVLPEQSKLGESVIVMLRERAQARNKTLRGF